MGYSLWTKRESILSNPEFDKYYDRKFLEDWIEKCGKISLEDILYTMGNISGHFLSQNIETPSKVIDVPISIELLEKEIQSFNPTHIGFSVMLDSYQTFIDCCHFLRKKHPQIKIIAGNVGALVLETENYADYVCKGEGTYFLRQLFGEKMDISLKIPRIIAKRFRPLPYNPKKFAEIPTAILTTDLGCAMGCDFCITYALYRRNYKIGNAAEIKKALLDMGEMINKRDIPVMITDPTGLTDEKLWEDVIELMKGENYCFHLNTLTTSALIDRYSKKGGLLDKFKRSEEFEIVLLEIGLESVAEKYAKNRNANWKEIIKTLNEYGIVSALSMIIGFDYHTRQTVLQEVKDALAFDSTIFYISNLKILYETKLWYLYKEQGRLLDVPPEFRMLWGYFAFTHPHFKSGFNDCLPLMLECEDLINENIGSFYLRSMKIIKNRKKSEYNDNLLKLDEFIKKD
jgi:hypothetical protein